MKTVVLVGCGNIGFRHLQALSAMATAAEITVVEPNLATHPRIEAHIVSTGDGPHRFRLLSGLDGAGLPKEVDLAVFATDTQHRRAAWDALTAAAQVRAVIFEKVLFATVGDIDAVAQDLAQAQSLGFVNCGRRGFPDYQGLARRFGGRDVPVDLAVRGTNFGLASNTVHFLDLAEMLNGADLVSVSAAGLEAGSKPSKRQGYVEIFGTIKGKLSNGATVSITCEDKDGIAVSVALAGHDGSRIEIDEVAARQTEGGTGAAFVIRNVSGMPELYETVLTSGTSALTPYAASARQHRLYLRALRDHLGLSNDADTPCPIS